MTKMTCEVCGKAYSRMAQHKSRSHGIQPATTAIDPARAIVAKVEAAIDARCDDLLPEVEKLAEKGLPLLDAILEYGERNDMDEQFLGSLVKRNRTLKSRLQEEAKRLRLLRPDDARAAA
jgi:hypothetical protein